MAMARMFAAALAGSLEVDDEKRDDLKLAFAEAARWAVTGPHTDMSLGVTSTSSVIVVEVEPVSGGEHPDGIDPLDVFATLADSVLLDEPRLRFEVTLT